MFNFLLPARSFTIPIGIGSYFHAQSQLRYKEQRSREQARFAAEVATRALSERLGVAADDIVFLESLTRPMVRMVAESARLNAVAAVFGALTMARPLAACLVDR